MRKINIEKMNMAAVSLLGERDFTSMAKLHTDVKTNICTVTEALWKGKPVVTSAVGGIQLQVKNKLTGLLCYSVEGAAYAVKRLLSNREYAAWLGKNAREHVRQNFLITRHLKDYLLLFISLYHPADAIYL